MLRYNMVTKRLSKKLMDASISNSKAKPWYIEYMTPSLGNSFDILTMLLAKTVASSALFADGKPLKNSSPTQSLFSKVVLGYCMLSSLRTDAHTLSRLKFD